MTPEHALAFVMGSHERLGADSDSKRLPVETLHMIIKFTLEPLHIKRAKNMGQYGHGWGTNSNAPNPEWLSKFMTVPEPDDIYRKHRLVTYYQYMKHCNRAIATEKAKICAWIQDLQRVDDNYYSLMHTYMHTWENPVRFFVPFSRQNKNKKGAWRHQFLMYETVNRDVAGVEQQCRDLFGNDNVDRFVRIRAVDGGVQVFVFGPNVPIDIIMASTIFTEYSYFQRWNRTMYYCLQRMTSRMRVQQGYITLEVC